jgi:hypothetical protein
MQQGELFLEFSDLLGKYVKRLEAPTVLRRKDSSLRPQSVTSS